MALVPNEMFRRMLKLFHRGDVKSCKRACVCFGPSAGVFSIFTLTWQQIYLLWTNLIWIPPPVNVASFIRCSSMIELLRHALPRGPACARVLRLLL